MGIHTRALTFTGAALIALAWGGLHAASWPIAANIFLLGMANGAFAVAAIGAMMSLAREGGDGREGVRMGLFGAAQAIAFGLGSFAGTAMVDVMRRLMDTTLPTIASVDGAVRAGGIGLMASCDLVVVNPSVTFALTEVRIGVAAAIISVPILGRVQPSRIAAAMLTGEAFDAREARDMGLVTHVAADARARGLSGGCPREAGRELGG